MVAPPLIKSPITKEEELHWLALRLIPGLGTRKAASEAVPGEHFTMEGREEDSCKYAAIGSPGYLQLL